MYRPPQLRTSERRRTERRRIASAAGRVTLRAGRGSVETPMSSEKSVATETPEAPIESWNRFMLKVYQKPDRSLGSDYYLIQREMAKRGKRTDATRYMLKAVTVIRQGSKFLAADSRGGLTTAIGSISTDHFNNDDIRDRMTTLVSAGSPLELRAIAAAFGEAREELRVRPEEITAVRVLPTTVIHSDRPKRFTVHVFVEMDLTDSVLLSTLERRRMKDMRDMSLPDTFRETGALHLLNDVHRFGPRTVSLLEVL